MDRKAMGGLLALFALLAGMAFAVPAVAWHPHEDDVLRDRIGIERDPENPLPQCQDAEEGEDYWSIDFEVWVCVNDKPEWLPDVVPDKYWEPVRPEDLEDPNNDPDDGGDVSWSRKWQPVPIPGYPNVYARVLTRSEWVNPRPDTGDCPNVTGGCKYKAGGDVNFARNVNGALQPFDLSRTWFKRALQTYTYNPTTKLWEKSHDTGWMQPASTGPAYVNEMVGTYDYGTAPYGTRWYFTRTQFSHWNGSAWTTPTIVDPVNSAGAIQPVWDDRPDFAGEKPPKPTKVPKVDKVKGSKKAPTLGNEADAVEAPAGAAGP
jgi:hypothetical protein